MYAYLLVHSLNVKYKSMTNKTFYIKDFVWQVKGLFLFFAVASGRREEKKNKNTTMTNILSRRKSVAKICLISFYLSIYTLFLHKDCDSLIKFHSNEQQKIERNKINKKHWNDKSARRQKRYRNERKNSKKVGNIFTKLK